MKDLTYAVIHKSQSYLSSLGQIGYRPLFGGYSLSVNDVIFAMACEGALYLRACDQCIDYFSKTSAPSLQYFKRGLPVQLNYYRVDDALWLEPEVLLKLSSYALRNAQRERAQRKAASRLKDLPNISLNIEMMLREAGIHDRATLALCGEKRAWLKIRNLKKPIGVKILMALAGAIRGVHAAVLPHEVRRDLTDWWQRYQQRHSG